jgi:hypothetical protein
MMFAELNLGSEEDLVGVAVTGVISLEMAGMVEVTKREGGFSSDGTPVDDYSLSRTRLVTSENPPNGCSRQKVTRVSGIDTHAGRRI